MRQPHRKQRTAMCPGRITDGALASGRSDQDTPRGLGPCMNISPPESEIRENPTSQQSTELTAKREETVKRVEMMENREAQFWPKRCQRKTPKVAPFLDP